MAEILAVIESANLEGKALLSEGLPEIYQNSILNSCSRV